MEDAMTLAEHLAVLRENAAMTQSELARRIGVDRRVVNNWETGLSRPTIDRLPQIASLLGVSVDTLLQPDTPLPSQLSPAEAASFSSDPATAQPVTVESVSIQPAAEGTMTEEGVQQ